MIDFLYEESIAGPGWFSQYDMAALYEGLKDSTKDDNYLEIGVDRGRSLTYARRHFKGDVYGIDIETLEERGGKPVEGTIFIHSDSLEVEWDKPIKCLFIDAEHRYQRVKDEYEKYLPFVVKGGWIFFHDSDETSPEVRKFTEEIGATQNPDTRSSMAWIRKK